mgnify:FL=1
MAGCTTCGNGNSTRQFLNTANGRRSQRVPTTCGSGKVRMKWDGETGNVKAKHNYGVLTKGQVFCVHEDDVDTLDVVVA